VSTAGDPLPVAPSARGAATTIIAQGTARAITLLVVALSTAVVTRSVPVDVFADWATVLSLIAILGFALDPGISPVVVRILAQDPSSAPTPAALRRLRLAAGCAALAIAVGTTVALRGGQAIGLALVLGGQLVPRALVLNATPWLQMDQRLHRQTALEAFCAGLGLAALTTIALLDNSAVPLAAVGFLLPTTLLAALMRRELRNSPSTRLRSPGPQQPKVRAVLREVLPLALALLLVTLYTRLGTIFVNVTEGAENVARFLLAFQFVEQSIVFGGIVSAGVLPLMAQRARVSSLLDDTPTHTLLCGVTAVGGVASVALLVLAEPLCLFLGGPGLVTASEYLVLLSPSAAVVLIAFALGSLHVSRGAGARYLRYNIVALVFSLVAHATLTLSYGASAAARVAWLTELVVVMLAFSPVWRAHGTGRRAGLRVAGCLATVIAAAEVTAGGLLPPVAAGAIALLAVLLIAGGDLRVIVQSVRATNASA
jgi:O-antigen/teichoic acid export membrane protein